MSIYPGFVYEQYPETPKGTRVYRKGVKTKKKNEEKKWKGRGLLIRAKDQSTAWHSSFWRSLALSYIGVSLSRNTTYHDEGVGKTGVRGGYSTSKKVGDKVTTNGGNGLRGKKRSLPPLSLSYPELQRRIIYATVLRAYLSPLDILLEII